MENASNGCVFVNAKYFEDHRHSRADKPYINVQQSKPPESKNKSSPSIDLNAINPTLHRYHTAHLRGRHGVIDYDNSQNDVQKELPKYWTLPKRTSYDSNGPRAIHSNQRLSNYPNKSLVEGRYEPTDRQVTNNEESIRISPIDPRASGPFKSSTPTNKDNIVNLSSKLLSPVKSTMTNEELYAVIHKSKKKLNIKETPDGTESPALSSISLSPVSSETSLYCKRQPETGYFGDPKSRTSWSPMDKPIPGTSITFGTQKTETTCADRFGPIPQTSRLDFKKLLLQHSVKLNTLNPQHKSNKLSAVEQLKLSKEKTQTPTTPAGNRSQVNILDLSGSPKTYTNRKVIKSNNQPLSPGRTGALIKEHKNTPKILLSPKSQWRFSSPRSDVLSTPIPEVNNEEENSNSSGEKHDISSPNDPPSKTVPIITNQHFGARRNLIPITEHNLEADRDYPESVDQGVFPLEADYSKTHGLSRSEILQAKRAEFFNTPPDTSPPRFTSFKSKPTNIGNTKNQNCPETGKTSPTTLETAL